MSTDQKLRLDPSPHEREARQYAERVYRTLCALEPLYDVPMAIEWLNSTQRQFVNGIPARMLGTHGGTAQIEAAIARILDGAFS